MTSQTPTQAEIRAPHCKTCGKIEPYLPSFAGDECEQCLLKPLLERLKRGVTSYQENEQILSYIRTLEKEHREMRESIETSVANLGEHEPGSTKREACVQAILQQVLSSLTLK